MNPRILPLLSAFAFLFGDFASSRAQVVADGATNTLSNTTNNFASVTVGTNGSFTLLTLSNNALLTNSGNGTIGLNITAKSNEVRLIGPTARWRMGNNFFVGSNGAFSRLIISNGALVENFNGVLGNVVSSSNNGVLVTGAGTTWSNRGDLAIGFSGRDNQLLVSNGGFVFNRFGYLGQQPGGSNNVARVIGSGSVWSNQFYLTVGGNDRSNRLIVEAGGLVTCSDGFVSASSSSGNNEVLVTGPGSLWSNRFFLFMGDVAGRNRLVVSNGATVWSGGSVLGTLSLALSNQVIVTGPGSVWTNESSLSLAEGSPGNRVEVSNGGRLECVDGLLGQTLAANSNAVLLTGNGSAWNNRASLIVGNSGSGNTLSASNGAIITASNLTIGVTANAAGNQVAIDGGALRVTNATGTGVLDVRRGAVSLRAGSVEADRLLITNAAGAFQLAGGTLITRGAAISNIGGFSISGSTTNPAVWEVRAGSAHALAVTLSVGSSLSFNQMLITNGGTLTSGDAYIGSNAGSRSNLALLSGVGSKWTAANLDVGNGGTFNRLIINNGAVVEAFNGALGQNSGSSNNLAVVTGPGSLWTNRNEMYVGYQGGGNQLVISNGGTVFAQATRFLGHNSGDISDNIAIVTGPGSRWIGPGNIEVGGPAAFCQLLVTGGGLVQNNSGLIGSGNTANNNLAMIAGAGSVWSNAMELRVGSSGAFNSLIISNGALVRNDVGYLGFNLNASNNLAVVTGAGSVWSNASSLLVGSSSASNQLVVTDHAAVFGYEGLIGYTPSSSNNVAVVTGAGSVWSNAVDLFVGNDGPGNHLVVSDGGMVRGPFGTVGLNPSSSNNEALVTGSASVWSNAVSLSVGNSGPANRLIVTNRGTVLAGNLISLGAFDSSSNNRVVVHGGNLFVTNSAGTGALDVRRGTNVFNAGLIEVDVLRMTNVLGKFEFNGGTLITRGALITNNNGFNVGSFGGNSGVWDVRTGPGAHVVESVNVGYFSPSNQMLITGGATMTNSGGGFIGLGNGAGFNTVTVAGAGSRWLLDSYLYVGYSDQFNRLVVTNGGFVAAGATIVGGEDNPTKSELIVSGIGSIYSNAANSLLQIGSDGATNRVRIENGGLLQANVRVGFGVPSPGNALLVSGPGSRVQTLTNLYPLTVGLNGAASRLEIRDGAVVSDFGGTLGSGSSGSNNLALVTGVGSLWTNHGELRIGQNGGGNQLVVSNGGTVFTFSSKALGHFDGSLSNTAIITDPGSAWLGDESLYVGGDGSFNRLFVRNGGRVASGIGTLGGLAAADGNQALVTDAGSSWTNQLDLNVGEGGSGNRLTISNAATLASLSHAFIGRNFTAASNSVTVTSPGSRWLISSNLFVGSNGPAASLIVLNGGRVENAFATLGGSLSSSNNGALISGAGSIWTNRNNVVVGGLGRGNSLVVSNGARVESDFAVLADGLSSSNNKVLVSGSGSIWTNRNEFNVGGLGPANQLVVANGGRVDCNHATVGLNTSASNNLAVVTDPGSFCRVNISLNIGRSSGGNRLVVSNGASFFDDEASIGLFSAHNEALVTGPGTTWTNRVGLSVGQLLGHNQLEISDGALVLAGNVFVSSHPNSTNNRVVVQGGTLLVTNTTGGAGALDVRRGTNVFNAGLIDVTRLFVTNTLGQFEFNGGQLACRETVIANGRPFAIGDGFRAATYELRGGLHSFANSLAIASNASLIGNGTITGNLTVSSGGELRPGTSIGNFILSNSPVLLGTTIMEIRNDNGTASHDRVQVAAPLTYGGSLVVTNTGSTALAPGNRFALFSASSYS
ncbi:MAG TPA: hypothetical protein VFZ59_27065, partial [Verrucomicrobiae bacterium]|nr:hypothetical protein [Verrucomicrobiae bacterium]